MIFGLPWCSAVKNPSVMQKTQVLSLGREDPIRRQWQPTPVFLSGESHRLSSLAGYSPGGHKESDMTERAEHVLTFYKCCYPQEVRESSLGAPMSHLRPCEKASQHTLSAFIKCSRDLRSYVDSILFLALKNIEKDRVTKEAS